MMNKILIIEDEEAIAELEKKGVAIRPETAKYKGEKMQAVYIDGEYGGFAIHLVQR